MLNIVAISFRQYAERAVGYNSYGSFFLCKLLSFL